MHQTQTKKTFILFLSKLLNRYSIVCVFALLFCFKCVFDIESQGCRSRVKAYAKFLFSVWWQLSDSVNVGFLWNETGLLVRECKWMQGMLGNQSGLCQAVADQPTHDWAHEMVPPNLTYSSRQINEIGTDTYIQMNIVIAGLHAPQYWMASKSIPPYRQTFACSAVGSFTWTSQLGVWLEFLLCVKYIDLCLMKMEDQEYDTMTEKCLTCLCFPLILHTFLTHLSLAHLVILSFCCHLLSISVSSSYLYWQITQCFQL